MALSATLKVPLALTSLRKPTRAEPLPPEPPSAAVTLVTPLPLNAGAAAIAVPSLRPSFWVRTQGCVDERPHLNVPLSFGPYLRSHAGTSRQKPRSRFMESKTFRRSAVALAIAGAFAIGVATADRVSMHTALAATTPPTVATPAVSAPANIAPVAAPSRLQRPGREIRPRGRQHQRHQRRSQEGVR